MADEVQNFVANAAQDFKPWDLLPAYNLFSGDLFKNIGNLFNGKDPLDLSGTRAAQNQYDAQLALQQQAQAYNSAEADKSRQWQEAMDNTSIQRRMADIKAAGLNPWLALQGSLAGAGSPSGSSASSSSGSATMANNKYAAAAGLIAMVIKILAK